MSSVPTAKPKSDRPMRADAARNRAAILTAAEELLGTDGPSLSTEAVARRAAVGVGTVFRHFPTKEELLEAVIAARLARLTERARALGLDPGGEALITFFQQVVEHTATTPTIHNALSALGVDPARALEAPKREFIAALDDLVQRAQTQGVVRSDVNTDEVFDLLVAAVHIAEARRQEHGRVRRVLEVIVAGLRPSSLRP